MNAVANEATLAIAEQFARACRQREYDKPVDYPNGAVLRFYYTLSRDLKTATLTDAVLISKAGAELNFELSVFSADELSEIVDEIEAML